MLELLPHLYFLTHEETFHINFVNTLLICFLLFVHEVQFVSSLAQSRERKPGQSEIGHDLVLPLPFTFTNRDHPLISFDENFCN